MKSALSSDTLKNHFAYSWWKYLMILVLGIMGVSLLYALTSPRVPDDKQLEVIVCGASMEQDFNNYMNLVRANQMPDIEQMEVTVIPDDDTALQYLTVRIGTQGGDIYILPRDQFEQMASNGALLPLEEDAKLMALLEGFDYESGWGTEGNQREMHIYGIPLVSRSGIPQFTGLDQYFYVSNGYLCLLRYGKNVENAKTFLRILCRDMMSDPSSWAGPRIYQVGLTVNGTSGDAGFSDRMKQLLAEQTDGNIRLQLMVQPDLDVIFSDFYDREIDIFIFPMDVYTRLAHEGDFLALENDELMLYLDPVDPDYWVINGKTGISNLYGIPLDQLPGLASCFSVENGVVCVRASDDYARYAIEVLRILCREMR